MTPITKRKLPEKERAPREVIVWIKPLRKKGTLVSRVMGLFGEVYYIIEVGRKELYFKKEDLTVTGF